MYCDIRHSFSKTYVLLIVGVAFCALSVTAHGVAPLAFDNFSEDELSTLKFAFAPPPGLSAGQVSLGDAPVQSEISDGHGLLISLNPGDGLLVVGMNEHAVGTEPVLVRALAWVSGPGATVALGALNVGDNFIGDCRMAYTTRRAAGAPSEGAELMAFVYSAPSGVLVPAFQAVLSPDAPGPVDVLFDNFEILPARFPEPTNTIKLDPPGDFEQRTDTLLTGLNGVKGQARIVSTESGRALELSTGSQANAANAGTVAYDVSPDVTGWLFAQATLVSSEPGPSLVTLVLTDGKQDIGVVDYPERLVGGDPVRVGGLFHGTSEFLLAAVQQSALLQMSFMSEKMVLDDLVVFYHTEDLEPEPTPTPVQEFEISAMMLVPEKMRVGNQSSVGITTLGSRDQTPKSVPVQVSIGKSASESIPLYTGSTNDNGHLNLPFQVPRLSAGTYQLQLAVEGGETLSSDVTVEEGPVLFIETDKPIYRPGQTIQGRVLALSNALTPLSSPIEISVSDAKGIKIHKETVESDAFGVAPFELPLASELNLGTWKIQAKSGDAETTLDLEIDRYVLPKFDVNLQPEKNWFLVDEEISGVIDAQYFFGKSVQGKVDLAASRYIGTWDQYATFAGQLADGEIQFTLPPVEYVTGTSSQEGAGTLQLDLVVTDESGHEERTNMLLKIVDAPVQAQLIAESETLKPGLPIQVLLITETPDGVPVDSTVSFKSSFWNESMELVSDSEQRVSTNNGLLLANVSVPEKTAMGQITADLAVDGHTTSYTLTLNAAYSPSASFLHIRQEEPGTYRVGDQASFTAFATNPGTIFYDVFASGRTVFSGATSERNIRFTVTPEMSPEAKIVAYLINPNNEISADVLPFDVEMVTTDTLSAEFSAEEVLPGDPVTLNLQALGEAMIGVSVVDESVYALSEGRLNLQQVFAELERIFMEPQVETHPEGNQWTGPRIGSEGAVDTLKSAGLQMVASRGFLVPEGQEMDVWRFWWGPGVVRGEGNFNIPMVPPEFEDDATAGGGQKSDLAEVQRIRQFFPETWLWDPQLLTDAAGSVELNLTAPDSVTTWRLHAVSTSDRGLGMTEGSIRVFQDFFVEPDLPYAVTRGEEFPLRLQVFNYVDSAQEVRLELKSADFFEPLGELVYVVTVEPSSVVGVDIPIKPTKVGLWTLEVVAQSATRADAIRKEFRVEPEGTRRESVTNGIIHEGETISLDAHYPGQIGPGPDVQTFAPNDPMGIVPDSEQMRIAITPSLVGQSINGIDDLLGMPYGCGEQNMIFLAPDIEVLRYLAFTGQLNPEVRAKAEHFVNVGYQRELTYRRNDGSFSAFGQSDESGSLWLTAFVLSTFSAARDIRTIDSTVLAEAATWIESQQLPDGSWQPVGFLHHNELIGGLNGNYGLTAYVLNALSTYSDGSETVRQNATAYLASLLTEVTDNPYALAVAAYALTRENHPAATQAVDTLLTLAQTDKNGMFWTPNSVETTSYAALALMDQIRPEAMSALSWIASQRNSLGGFGSTQDTVMAFRALTEAAMRQSRDLDATIDVVLDGAVLHTFPVNGDNFDVLQIFEIPNEGDLEIRHTGTGDVTYQLAKIFNVWDTEGSLIQNGMDLNVEYSADHVAVDDLVDVRVSATFLGLGGPEPGEPEGGFDPIRGEPLPPDGDDNPTPPVPVSSGMIILDISVPTGFATVQETLDRVLEMENVKRIEKAGRKVIFYIDGLKPDESIEFAFQVKALFPVKAIVGTSSAYSYYNTDIRAEAGGPGIVVE
ncbi:MAG: alpha-2-macroglobulin family protein [bacterium]